MSTQDEYELRILFGDAKRKAVELFKDDHDNGDTAIYQFITDIIPLVLAREQSIKEQARRVAKQESAHDFDNIVKAYNLAIESKFDRLSVTRLYFAINGADNRAKFIDLPEQTALHSTSNSLEEK